MRKKKFLITIFFILISLSSLTFAQSMSFSGNIYINSYYAYFIGDPSLSYLSSDIQEGIYFQQNSHFSISYISKFIFKLEYKSQPKEKVESSIKIGNFYEILAMNSIKVFLSYPLQ